MSTHALASLTATYTDSEPEGEDDDVAMQDDERRSHSDEDQDRVGIESLNNNFRIPNQENIVSSNRMAQLVSYHDDTVVSDDDAENFQPHMEDLEIEKTDTRETDNLNDIELPPEPSGRCSPRVQEKVARLYEKMQSGLNMNNTIQSRKDFRNPSIYEKLIQFCGINELGTNYPPRIYDPLKWGKESYFEELAKVQKIEMDKREKEKKERTKVEFVSGTAKKVKDGSVGNEEELKKRKSKWDQVGSNVAALSAVNAGSIGLIRASYLSSLTTTATGTKGTVISAFGSLPKKPRI